MDTTANTSVITVYVENTYKGSFSAMSQVESIPWSHWLQAWFDSLSTSNNLAPDCEIGLRITGDRQIQELNYQYRSLNNPTDVLAFAATEADIIIPTEFTEPLYLGDIIISLDTAVKQATTQDHSLVVELAWLASHGVLHLLGWDHPNDEALQKMLHQQSQLVQLVER